MEEESDNVDGDYVLASDYDALAARVELLESRLADAARLLKDAAPPWAGMTAAEDAEIIREWSAARAKFIEDVIGKADRADENFKAVE
jgi:hypothetical protein